MKCATVLIGLVLVLSSFTPLTATVIWSEDFNDGNYDGWAVALGSFHITAGSLRSEDSSDLYNTIWENSSTTVGTWNFSHYQIHHPSTSGFYYIMFMVNGTVDPMLLYGYGISVRATNDDIDESFRLIKRSGGAQTTLALAVYPTDGVDFTWTDFAVSRNSTGGLNVWINGTHEFEVVDSDHDYSEKFVYYTQGGFPAHGILGGGLDNISVSDEPLSPPASATPTPTASPTPTEPGPNGQIDPVLLAVVGGAAVVLIVLAVVCSKRR